MAGEVRPRPGPAPSHSTPRLTAPVCHRPAQRTTEVPANSRHHGPRAVPSVSSVLILPPGPIADRHRRPQERLQAAPRSPAYPNTSPDNRACNSLTPFRCPHAVHLYESVDSGQDHVLFQDVGVVAEAAPALVRPVDAGPLVGNPIPVGYHRVALVLVLLRKLRTPLSDLLEIHPRLEVLQ